MIYVIERMYQFDTLLILTKDNRGLILPEVSSGLTIKVGGRVYVDGVKGQGVLGSSSLFGLSKYDHPMLCPRNQHSYG